MSHAACCLLYTASKLPWRGGSRFLSVRPACLRSVRHAGACGCLLACAHFLLSRCTAMRCSSAVSGSTAHARAGSMRTAHRQHAAGGELDRWHFGHCACLRLPAAVQAAGTPCGTRACARTNSLSLTVGQRSKATRSDRRELSRVCHVSSLLAECD